MDDSDEEEQSLINLCLEKKAKKPDQYSSQDSLRKKKTQNYGNLHKQ